MLIEWLNSNHTWIFGGVGVSLLSGLVWLIRHYGREPSQNGVQISNINNINAVLPESVVSGSVSQPSQDIKQSTRILFIDDDTTFKVVKIIKAAGWPHTKIVKDVKSIECPEIQEATILFVDVQGVGRALGFSNEGLGLALAIKKKFQDKKVVIYSAQSSGDRFDEALRKADDFLLKNADPYEFLALVDRLSCEA